MQLLVSQITEGFSQLSRIVQKNVIAEPKLLAKKTDSLGKIFKIEEGDNSRNSEPTVTMISSLIDIFTAP